MTTTAPSTSSTSSAASSAWRSPGLWLCALLIGYMLFNATRAVLSPAAFAAAFGVPLGNPADDTFVLVYAVRALFLGVFGLALLVRRNYAGLALFVLVATLMPIGDALIVAQSGAGLAAVARHIVIAGVVLLTWYLTQRWVRRATS
jgi:hypothetical protein